MPARPRVPRSRDRPPVREELLMLLDALEIVLSDLMTRWQDGIPPDVRAEIMTRAYEPVLMMLIRARRRPLPR